MAHHKVQVLIIGAGISGIGAGIRLLEAGFTDFVILEKGAEPGGTWRDNTYPGCACDVPSHLYSYSFEQKPDWTRVFANQPEILDYVRGTAAKYNILPYIRFNQPAEHAQWNESAGHWVVRSPSQVYHATAVIACSGYLHEPIVPNLPGLKEFPGTLFHSSRWNHAHDLSGERIAVIGTGASAIQFVPKVQPLASKLHVYQRTAQWVLPKGNARVSDAAKAILRRPWALNLWRQMLFLGFESFGIGFRHPALLKQAQKIGLSHLKRQVKDPELRAKLTPDYILGCKRTLMSNDYYRSLTRDNAEVLATGVKEVRGRTVVGIDGSEREVDTIILGTGFYVTEQPIAQRIHDAQGRTLSDLWRDGMQAYRGTTIAGLPNLFMVLGPNLGIGHNSAFVVIEAQLQYIMSALKQMRAKGLGRFEVSAQVQSAYNKIVQRDLQQTVWNTGGCSSYYLDKNGFNSIGFPWSTLKMRRLLNRFDIENYQTRPLAAPASEAVHAAA